MRATAGERWRHDPRVGKWLRTDWSSSGALSLLSVASDRYPIDEEIISESDAAFYRAMMRAGIIRRIG